MKKLKKVTAYLLILRLILSAVLIVPSVSAEEVSPYDYSSFTGDWYCNIQGHTEGISGLYTLSIGGARDNMICLPQMNNAWYPIKDNKVSFSVVPSDELNWTIRHNADVYAIDLTFYDDSICMTAYVKERYLADSIPQDTYVDTYWFTSDTIKPRRIETQIQQQLFSDISEDNWAYAYIKELSDMGILNGYEDGSFRPGSPVTRSEWSKMLVSTFGIPIDEFWRMTIDLQNCDVRVSDWYAPYIYTAEPYFNAAHIDTGDQPYVQYSPLEGATREDVTVSIVKVLEAAGYQISADSALPFNDADTIRPEAKRYIAFAVNNSIISGFEDNTFRGQGTLTRAEAATILYRSMIFVD